MNDARHFGMLAEFASADALLGAVREARGAGYTSIEAFAPFPVEGLADALGFKRNCIPLVTLLGGLLGGAGTYFMLWYSAVIDYPIDSGARPLNSWPAFIPATFELTILGAALAAFVALLLANGLPRLNHPIFNAPDFDLASRNRFFLCIRCDDPRFEQERTRRFLAALEPMRIVEVPA
jgi:Protein of unknown function (DUF3341)